MYSVPAALAASWLEFGCMEFHWTFTEVRSSPWFVRYLLAVLRLHLFHCFDVASVPMFSTPQPWLRLRGQSGSIVQHPVKLWWRRLFWRCSKICKNNKYNTSVAVYWNLFYSFYFQEGSNQRSVHLQSFENDPPAAWVDIHAVGYGFRFRIQNSKLRVEVGPSLWLANLADSATVTISGPCRPGPARGPGPVESEWTPADSGGHSW